MHLVDTTMFLAPEGGGVGRYLGVKHEWLSRHTSVRHTVLAPGTQDGVANGVVRVRTRIAGFSNGYRFPLALGEWKRKLLGLSPDVLEAADPYLPAWAALSAGQAAGIPVVGFYHSDMPRAAAVRF